MFENVTHLRFAPEGFDEGLQIVKHQIVPVLRAQRGLLSLALLPNRALRQISILSLWASPECSMAVERSARYQHLTGMLDGLLAHNSSQKDFPTYQVTRAEFSHN